MAHRLQSCLRETDIAARLGGDEFAVVLSDLAHPLDASHVARVIATRLASPVLYGKEPMQVGASIGISIYPADGKEPEQLLKNADIALYRAKSEGRNRHCFFVRPIHEAGRRPRIGTELRRSSNQDCVQGYLPVQPTAVSSRLLASNARRLREHG